MACVHTLVCLVTHDHLFLLNFNQIYIMQYMCYYAVTVPVKQFHALSTKGVVFTNSW